MRLGEALAIGLAEIDIDRAFIYLPKTKNSEPRAVYLLTLLVLAIGDSRRGRRLRNAEKSTPARNSSIAIPTAACSVSTLAAVCATC
jgi:integrase